MKANVTDKPKDSNLMSIDNFTYDDKNFIPQIISESYRQISCLKHTKEKQVYVVEEKTTGEKYILKCALNDGAKFLETEYIFLKEHDFDFLPKAVWGKKIDHGFYMLRQYFKGENLESYVEKKGCLPTKEALEIINKIGGFISKLHHQNPPILHRDIKPQNFLRTYDGEYKIIDMETMKYYKESSDFDTVIIGTRTTAAPEQFGYQKSAVQTDIYSLGVLLVYLLTGDYSLKKKNLKDTPRPLQKIIAKSTAFDPKKRYKTVDVLMKEIQFYNRFKIRWNTARISILLLIIALILGGYLYKLKEIYETKHTRNESYIDANEEVEFKNSRIDIAVRQYLGKSSDEVILAKELEQIETLIIIGDKLFDNWEIYNEYYQAKWYEIGQMKQPVDEFLPEDLKYFTNLKELALDVQNVTSLEGIENLPLKKISVAMNNLTDASPITQIESLELVRISGNPIKSLEGFENLSHLENLNLSDTKADDLEPIKNCPLTDLDCSYGKVTDYGFLKSLNLLQTLRVGNVDRATVEYINTLEELENLTIVRSEISSLTQLSNLKNLISLDVSDSVMLTSLEGIENFKKLEYIAFISTNVSDISPVRSLKCLYTIEPSYSPVTDFTPLLECPVFNCMYVNKDLAEIAKEQLKDRRITYNIVD